MSEIAKILGKRIRNYRTTMGLSQEKLAELSGCHHTYIGQIERGEKNATIESIEKYPRHSVFLSQSFLKNWAHKRTEVAIFRLNATNFSLLKRKRSRSKLSVSS